MNVLLIGAFIYLFFALIGVQLCKKFGLGSVLGYLLAGVVIGPMLHFAGEETAMLQEVAEFGVVMMLFLVGLELEPSKLWQLRYKLVGLGGLQVVLSVLLLMLAAHTFFDLRWQTSLAIGLVLSLSSTAIVLQTLEEKNLMSTSGGQSSFAVLLFQDIAAIPMMALLPLLFLPELLSMQTSGGASHDDIDLLSGFNGYIKAAVTVVVIAAIVVLEHYLAPFVLKFIAKLRMREIFTLFTLALVIGIAVVMSMIGLSPALGAFIAGMVLATSQYRHVLETNLEPFKGLLMGLFFMTVGAQIKADLLVDQFFIIIGATIGLLAIKMLVLYVLSKIFKLKSPYTILFTLALAQAGEFGFVLIELGAHNAVLAENVADVLRMVVTISMVITPLFFVFYDKVVVPRSERKFADNKKKTDTDIPTDRPIIIVGFGRYGQVINTMLNSLGYETTVIDGDPDTAEGFTKHGVKTYYGDGSRLNFLNTAGLGNASLLIVAIDNREQATQLVHEVRLAYPRLKIIARAKDRSHVYDLYYAGANNIVRETFDSAVRTGVHALEFLNVDHDKAFEIGQIYALRDRKMTQAIADAYNPDLAILENSEMVKIADEYLQETSRILKEHLKAAPEETEADGAVESPARQTELPKPAQ